LDMCQLYELMDVAKVLDKSTTSKTAQAVPMCPGCKSSLGTGAQVVAPSGVKWHRECYQEEQDREQERGLANAEYAAEGGRGPTPNPTRMAQTIPDDGFADGGAAYTDEEMDLMEGKTQPKKAEEPRRWAVKVTFDDGDHLETWINGTQDEIRMYYLSNDFVLGDETTMHKPIKVEFLEDLGEVPWTYWGEAKRPKADKEAKSLWELKKAAQFVPSYRDKPNRTHEMPRGKPPEPPEGATYIDSGYWELPAGVAKRLCGGTLPRAGYERIVEFDGSKWAIHQTPVHGKMVWGLRWIKNLDVTEITKGIL